MLDLIFAALIALAIFLICREIICWYWKLNKLVKLLESIDARLARLEAGAAPSVLASRASGKSKMLSKAR